MLVGGIINDECIIFLPQQGNIDFIDSFLHITSGIAT